jgi:hypothetical protein
MMKFRKGQNGEFASNLTPMVLFITIHRIVTESTTKATTAATKIRPNKENTATSATLVQTCDQDNSAIVNGSKETASKTKATTAAKTIRAHKENTATSATLVKTCDQDNSAIVNGSKEDEREVTEGRNAHQKGSIILADC